MIRKKDLLEGLDANTEQIIWQGQLITELKKRIEKLENKKCYEKEQVQGAKRKPGRPRK